MKVFFLGSFFPLEFEEDIKNNSIGPIANANNALQWSYIKGLRFFYPSLEVITLPQIGAFPFRYKKLYFKGNKRRISFDNEFLGYSVGFLNLPGLKHFHRFLKIKRVLTDLISKTKKEKIVIIVYDLHPPYLKALDKIKSKNRNLSLCVIVPDLPDMTGAPKDFFHRSFLKMGNSILESTYDCIDKYVLVSRFMVEKLPEMNKPWLVIEGMFSDNEQVSIFTNAMLENNKVVFYSGALDERNGINRLIEAFMLIPKENYRLIICGDGECRYYLSAAMKKDDRIIYKGQLPREDVLTLQQRSTLLVNPRTSDGEFSKYSFPSKTMEYFASGVPVLMYQLAGVPEEYYSLCYSISGNDVNELKEKIIAICEQNPSLLKDIGTRARKFILEKKNPVEQCRKLVNFIDENSSSD